MIAFVDEAGYTGFKLSQGSSQFFIITLVIFDQNEEAAACDQRITLLRRELGLATGFEFHFNETPDRLKRLFFKKNFGSTVVLLGTESWWLKFGRQRCISKSTSHKTKREIEEN